MPQTPTVRVAIAEDSPACARQLQDCLHRYEELHGACFAVSVYQSGAELLEHYRGDWDLVFLDIDMPGMNGMDTARELRSMDQAVMLIFVTNLAQYAIQGYSVGAFDYILKPLHYYEMDMKLQLALRQFGGRQEKSILIKLDGDLHRIPVAQIDYIEINSHRIYYYTRQGRFESSSGQTLRQLESMLAPYGFVRCNKGTLINIRHVKCLNGDTLTLTEATLVVSRSHRKAVMEMLLQLAKGGILT